MVQSQGQMRGTRNRRRRLHGWQSQQLLDANSGLQNEIPTRDATAT
jgi:hypothetical protein